MGTLELIHICSVVSLLDSFSSRRRRRRRHRVVAMFPGITNSPLPALPPG